MHYVDGVALTKDELRHVNVLRGQVVDFELEGVDGYAYFVGFHGSLNVADGTYVGRYVFGEDTQELPGTVSVEDLPGLAGEQEDGDSYAGPELDGRGEHAVVEHSDDGGPVEGVDRDDSGL